MPSRACPPITRGCIAKRRSVPSGSQGNATFPPRHCSGNCGAIWQALARVHHELGEYPRSLELQLRAVAQMRRDGNPQLLGEALLRQAWAYYFQDDLRHFLESAEESQRVLSRAGLTEDAGYADTSSALGLAYFVNGQPAQA